MSRGQARGWDLAIPVEVRVMARRVASGDGTRVAKYVEALLRADFARRGISLAEGLPPSQAERIRVYVRAQGGRPVSGGEVVLALGVKRETVDSVLSRSTTKGVLERVEGGYVASGTEATRG